MFEKGMMILPLEECARIETQLENCAKEITKLKSELKTWRQLRPELHYVEREYPDGTPYGCLEIKDGYHD